MGVGVVAVQEGEELEGFWAVVPEALEGFVDQVLGPVCGVGLEGLGEGFWVGFEDEIGEGYVLGW